MLKQMEESGRTCQVLNISRLATPTSGRLQGAESLGTGTEGHGNLPVTIAVLSFSAFQGKMAALFFYGTFFIVLYRHGKVIG